MTSDSKSGHHPSITFTILQSLRALSFLSDPVVPQVPTVVASHFISFPCSSQLNRTARVQTYPLTLCFARLCPPVFLVPLPSPLARQTNLTKSLTTSSRRSPPPLCSRRRCASSPSSAFSSSPPTCRLDLLISTSQPTPAPRCASRSPLSCRRRRLRAASTITPTSRQLRLLCLILPLSLPRRRRASPPSSASAVAASKPPPHFRQATSAGLRAVPLASVEEHRRRLSAAPVRCPSTSHCRRTHAAAVCSHPTSHAAAAHQPPPSASVLPPSPPPCRLRRLISACRRRH